jgi:hypothetical protein
MVYVYGHLGISFVLSAILATPGCEMQEANSDSPHGFGGSTLASNDSSSKPTPLIQFLSFDGCPLAGAAQAALERALQICGMDSSQYEPVDVLDPATPSSLTSWGSPTILVNGRDVTGHARGDGVGCRIYDTADKVPAAATIATEIQKSAGV